MILWRRARLRLTRGLSTRSGSILLLLFGRQRPGSSALTVDPIVRVWVPRTIVVMSVVDVPFSLSRRSIRSYLLLVPSNGISRLAFFWKACVLVAVIKQRIKNVVHCPFDGSIDRTPGIIGVTLQLLRAHGARNCCHAVKDALGDCATGEGFPDARIFDAVPGRIAPLHWIVVVPHEGLLGHRVVYVAGIGVRGKPLSARRIVGARALHDAASGQWLTPDAYAGDVRDPMSQKPFMWNGNNSLLYSDPSGYTIDWTSMSTDVLNAISDLMSASGTFSDEINAMENDTHNTYSFATATLGQGIEGATLSNGAGSIVLEVSSEDSGQHLDADIAHEAGHGADIANNLFETFNKSIPGAVSANGENDTYEEAHGYMLENQVLTEAFGDDNANSLMERQLPQWNGIDQPPWSMELIQSTFCSQFGGASGC
jgi:hypothetical protein